VGPHLVQLFPDQKPSAFNIPKCV